MSLGFRKFTKPQLLEVEKKETWDVDVESDKHSEQVFIKVTSICKSSGSRKTGGFMSF